MDLTYYRKKYNINQGDKCEICAKYDKPQHSIKFIKVIENFGIIYIKPSIAINRDIYYICQHLIMELDKCFLKLKKIKNKKIILLFNMENSKTSFKNLKTAKKMYRILNDCYIDYIEQIYVYNMNILLSLFTKSFSSVFNNKIICKKPDFI